MYFGTELQEVTTQLGKAAKVALNQFRGASTTDATEFLGWCRPDRVMAKRIFWFICRCGRNGQRWAELKQLMRMAFREPDFQRFHWTERALGLVHTEMEGTSFGLTSR